MHGADNISNPSTTGGKAASATGANSVIRTKMAIEKSVAATLSNQTGAAKQKMAKKTKQPSEANAGCNAWWSF